MCVFKPSFTLVALITQKSFLVVAKKASGCCETEAAILALICIVFLFIHPLAGVGPHL